jgi:hypothetical protein
MRGWIVVALLALALTGCGATADETRDETGGGGEASMSAGAAVERCSERLLRNAELEELSAKEREAARRYAESTYCARFAERGWVYDDGTLSIDAYRWLAEAGEEVCAEAEAAQEGEPAGPVRTVPCDEVDAGEDPGIIECAGLEYVRESEVREYLDGLQRRHGSVECEDGTPLADVGTQVPPSLVGI